MRNRNERLTLRLTKEEKKLIIEYFKIINSSVNTGVYNLVKEELEKCRKNGKM